MTKNIDELISLVHDRDLLFAERLKINQKITEIDVQLHALLEDDAPPRVTIARRRNTKVRDKAVSFLREHKDADYEALAKALYSSKKPAAMARARSLIFQLRKLDMIEGQSGSWTLKKNGLTNGESLQ